MRNTLRAICPRLAAASLIFLFAARAALNPTDYFTITVVDEDTGRGVPLVELKTTNNIAYYTDSNGIVAFYEPGLMDQKVYFHIKSHGYEFPADGFGNRGKALKVTPGGAAVIKVKRINIAERLYRVTGEGIYRDSVLVGHAVPTKHPVLNGQVMGQDTVKATPYRGKIYWFYGDTDKPSYPLGNFGTSGATSELPSNGGLDPGVGIDLAYFVDESGFSKPMFPSSAFPGPGPKWITAVMTVKGENGAERLLARYDRIKILGEAYERGLGIFNDKTETFERLVKFDMNAPLLPAGRPFRVGVDREEYYYFPSWYPLPLIRVKADMQHIADTRAYQGFTCLAAGSKYEKNATKLDRGADGRLIYAWKTGTEPLSYEQQRELTRAGKLKPDEGLLHLTDIDTGAVIEGHSGSVYWNDFRKRWVMIVQKSVGEVWYAEGDTPLGPWVYARKIVSHDRYTFYWPGQHPYFDQDGGRLIYFQGTYTDSFSGNPEKTPWYNYNQIMYRLNLNDPRLYLPVPVYRVKDSVGGVRYLTREGVQTQNEWDGIEDAAFFALPPDRQREGLVPIFAASEKGGMVLYREPPAAETQHAQPLFYALPGRLAPREEMLAGTWQCQSKSSDGSEYQFNLELKVEGDNVTGPPRQDGLQITKGTFKNGKLELQVKIDEDSYTLTGNLEQGKLVGQYKQINGNEKGTWQGERTDSSWRQEKSPAVVPLYEYRDTSRGSRLYSTNPELKGAALKRSAEPLCRVWRNPMSLLILDRKAKPIP